VIQPGACIQVVTVNIYGVGVVARKKHIPCDVICIIAIHPYGIATVIFKRAVVGNQTRIPDIAPDTVGGIIINFTVGYCQDRNAGKLVV
jgi:hypothetical protein